MIDSSVSASGQGAESGITRNRIDLASWGLFFAWVGISIFLDLGWGWSLIGIGAIILAAQAALQFANENVEGFWIACGAVFIAGGLWELLDLRWPLTPILLILFGAIMVWRALFGATA